MVPVAWSTCVQLEGPLGRRLYIEGRQSVLKLPPVLTNIAKKVWLCFLSECAL